jgi:hypothetical protein
LKGTGFSPYPSSELVAELALATEGKFSLMTRLASMVVSGLSHHVTQRGNRRESIFLEDGDQEIYRDLLGEQADVYNETSREPILTLEEMARGDASHRE